jgi:hypothetical protein
MLRLRGSQLGQGASNTRILRRSSRRANPPEHMKEHVKQTAGHEGRRAPPLRVRDRNRVRVVGHRQRGGKAPGRNPTGPGHGDHVGWGADHHRVVPIVPSAQPDVPEDGQGVISLVAGRADDPDELRASALVKPETWSVPVPSILEPARWLSPVLMPSVVPFAMFHCAPPAIDRAPAATTSVVGRIHAEAATSTLPERDRAAPGARRLTPTANLIEQDAMAGTRRERGSGVSAQLRAPAWLSVNQGPGPRPQPPHDAEVPDVATLRRRPQDRADHAIHGGVAVLEVVRIVHDRASIR